MVVWGGGSYLNTGGRYDPATDAWTATSTVEAPSGRSYHTAIWTGSLMVVWGGYYYDGGTVYLNTGGRYDPATDTWTATSIMAAPSGRSYHTAVWTGGLMVVWGGSGGYLSTGGRYVVGADIPDADGDGSIACADCDENNPAIYPGAPQICDGINNDCSDPSWPAVPANEVDVDGDGFQICDGDCDDADPDIFPNAAEINDGKDNQCPGDPGFGIVDEISGALIVGNPSEISWPAQAGATAYEVIRAIGPLFPPVCAGGITGAPSWSDSEIPPAGGTFYYLVRPVAPYVGSWGVDSTGVERTGLCGEE